MISFIIPAHNEELWIGKCLGSIRAAMEKIAEPHEVILADDASTDSTPRIVAEMGARTLRVEHRKISAVRNAGARVVNPWQVLTLMLPSPFAVCATRENGLWIFYMEDGRKI